VEWPRLPNPRGLASASGRIAQSLREDFNGDPFIYVGLPLLLLVGAALGIVTFVSLIRLLGALLGA